MDTYIISISGTVDAKAQTFFTFDLHIVKLVEEKAALIEAGEATAFDPHAANQREAAE